MKQKQKQKNTWANIALWVMFIAHSVYMGWHEAHVTRRLKQLGFEDQIPLHEGSYAFGSLAGAAGLIIASWWFGKRNKELPYNKVLVHSAVLLLVMLGLYAVGIWQASIWLLVMVRFVEGAAFNNLYAAIQDVFQRRIAHLNGPVRRRKLATRVLIASFALFAANMLGYWLGVPSMWWVLLAGMPVLAITTLGVVVSRCPLPKQAQSREAACADTPYSPMRVFLLLYVISTVLVVYSEIVVDYLPLVAGDQAKTVSTLSQLSFGVVAGVAAFVFGGLKGKQGTKIIIGGILAMSITPLMIWGGTALLLLLVSTALAGAGKGVIDGRMKDGLRKQYGARTIPMQAISYAVAMVITSFVAGGLFNTVGVHHMWIYVEVIILVVPLILLMPLPRWYQEKGTNRIRVRGLSLMKESFVTGKVPINWRLGIKNFLSVMALVCACKRYQVMYHFRRN